MEDLAVVEGLEASDDLDEDVPYFLFLNVSFSFLIVAYFLEDIAIIGVFHHKTKKVRGCKLLTKDCSMFHQ